MLNVNSIQNLEMLKWLGEAARECLRTSLVVDGLPDFVFYPDPNVELPINIRKYVNDTITRLEFKGFKSDKVLLMRTVDVPYIPNVSMSITLSYNCGNVGAWSVLARTDGYYYHLVKDNVRDYVERYSNSGTLSERYHYGISVYTKPDGSLHVKQGYMTTPSVTDPVVQLLAEDDVRGRKVTFFNAMVNNIHRLTGGQFGYIPPTTRGAYVSAINNSSLDADCFSVTKLYEFSIFWNDTIVHDYDNGQVRLLVEKLCKLLGVPFIEVTNIVFRDICDGGVVEVTEEEPFLTYLRRVRSLNDLTNYTKILLLTETSEASDSKCEDSFKIIGFNRDLPNGVLLGTVNNALTSPDNLRLLTKDTELTVLRY
jgi:hypothetical protein